MWWKSVVWPAMKTLAGVFVVSGTAGTVAYLVKTVSTESDVLRDVQDLLRSRIDD